MPDSFGNPTPQEVQQQILQQQQAKLSAAFANNPSGFGKAGVGIGNALGGLFSKNKKDPRVVAAEKVQKATMGAKETLAFLSDKMDPRAARAVVLNNMARTAREVGDFDSSIKIQNEVDAIRKTLDQEQRGVDEAASIKANRESTKRAQRREGSEFVVEEFDFEGNLLGEISRSPISQPQITFETDVDPRIGGASVSKQILDFRKSGVAAADAYRSATTLLDIAKDSPASLGRSGAITSFGNNMIQMANNLSSILEVEDFDAKDYAEDRFDFESFDQGVLKDTAIESSVFRSGILNIAISTVLAAQGSRPSDKDIQLQIDRIGGSTDDPDAFDATMRFFMDGIYGRLQDTATLNPLISDKERTRVFGVVDSSRVAFDGAGSGANAFPGMTGEQIKELKELRRKQAARDEE